MTTGKETYTVGLQDLAPAARIREVALRLFAEHGPRATSIRMVAAAVGVSPGGLLHHYPTKDELELAVLDSVLERLGNAITGVGLHSPTVDALRQRRSATDEFLTDNPVIAAYLRNVYFGGGPEAARVFAAMGALQRQQMGQMIEVGLARPMPDPEVGMLLYQLLQAAPMFLQPLLDGAQHELDLDDPDVRDRFREALIDLLTHPLFLDR